MKAKLAEASVVFDRYPVLAACLKICYPEFSKRYSVTLPGYEEAGVGPAHGGMFLLSSGKPVYYCSLEWAERDGSYFECGSDEVLEEIVDQIMRDFDLTSEDFFWTAKDAGFGSFVVTRQDDHGNEFEIAAFDNRFDAVRLKDELETYQHKQSYAIEGRKEPLPSKPVKIDYSAYKI